MDRAYWINLDPKAAVQVEKSVGEFRKMLRFGTFFDTLYAVKNLSINDPVLKTLVAVQRVALAGFLFNDHLIWLRSKGVVGDWVDPAVFGKSSNRWWLAAILAALVKDCYELKRALKAKRGKNPIDIQTVVVELSQRKEILNDLVKNLFDSLIALNGLGFISLSPTKVAFAGIISSVAGTLPLVNHTFKL